METWKQFRKMKPAAVRWLQKVPERQRQCVAGYLKELRELFPANESYYIVPREALVYCTLYQWEVNEKLMTFGSPNIGLNQNGDAAKITASEDTIQNVYGSVLVDPTLDAVYCWEVFICNELEERHSGDRLDLGLGFIGQPNESFTPPVDGNFPFQLDLRAKEACIYYADDGRLVGFPGDIERTSGPWGSRDSFLIFVHTKSEDIWWNRGLHSSVFGPPRPNLEKWKTMNFGKHDGEHAYGDEDDDIKPKKVGQPINIDEKLEVNILDWSVPFRLALCMKGNGWFKVEKFELSLEEYI